MCPADRSISPVGFVPDIPSLDFRTISLCVLAKLAGSVGLKQAQLSPINEEQLSLR